MGTNTRPHINDESLSLWYQALLNRYDNVISSNNAIDSKSGVLLASNIAVLAISTPTVITSPSILGICGGVGLLVSSAVATSLIHVRSTKDPVVTTNERIDYYYKQNHDFIWQLVADVEQATELNKVINESKARLYSWVVYVFLASSIVLLLSQFVSITFGSN